MGISNYKHWKTTWYVQVNVINGHDTLHFDIQLDEKTKGYVNKMKVSI